MLQRRTGGPDDDGGSMPLVEHLRELRRRLLVCLVALVPGAVAGFVFNDPLIRFLTEPICDVPGGATEASTQCGPLVYQGLLSPFSIMVKVALATAVLASAPVWLYQAWAFDTPGLYRNERRWSLAFLATAIPLFFAGAALCYLVLPKATRLLIGFAPADIGVLVPFNDYLSIVLRLILVFGLAFLAPVFVVLLNAAGLLPAANLRRWWRGIVFGVFVFAAVATPTGDPLTMLALALPVLGLLGVAYGIALVGDRRRAGDEPDYSALGDDKASRLPD